MAGATQSSIVVQKSMLWRGVAHVWSNRYYLNNVPPDNAHWTTLSDAITAAEKAIYTNENTIVKTIGYLAGSDVPVFTKTYALTGTGGWATTTLQAKEVAQLIRYSTSQRTSKNHPVYLFNYYHGVSNQGSSFPDQAASSQFTAYGTYANAWVSGFSDGTTTYKKTGPHGAVAQAYVVEQYLTHRDFRH